MTPLELVRTPLRVAFLTNFVSPYRRPVFESLAATEGWDFRVFVNATSEFDRNWTVDTSKLEVTQSKTWTRRRIRHHQTPIHYTEELSLHVPVGLFGDLRRFRPDVIVSCELGPRSMVAAAYAKVYDVPLVIWSYHSLASMGCGKLQLAIRKTLLGACKSVVGMGEQAREVLERWNVPSSRIVDLLNATDHATLEKRASEPGAQARADERRRALVGDRRVILVVGRLIPLKGTAEILEAWRSLPQSLRNQWAIVFVGSGPFAPMVEAAKDEHCHLAGHVAPSEMADWYLAADLHLFASLGDVWGLVVNEAMGLGTPTICSVHAGAWNDLIENGKSGFTFDPTIPQDFTRVLEDAMTHEDLGGIAAAAKASVARCSSEAMAERFRVAVAKALGHAPAPPQVEATRRAA